jgi:hypothetical protein
VLSTMAVDQPRFKAEHVSVDYIGSVRVVTEVTNESNSSWSPVSKYATISSSRRGVCR